MTRHDLESEFRDTADFYFGISFDEYNKNFVFFLIDRCIGLESERNTVLNTANSSTPTKEKYKLEAENDVLKELVRDSVKERKVEVSTLGEHIAKLSQSNEEIRKKLRKSNEKESLIKQEVRDLESQIESLKRQIKA